MQYNYLHETSLKVPDFDLIIKNGIIFVEKKMKNAFSREIPQRFSRYKKGKCGKPSGENPKVWYGDSNAAVRM